MIRTWCMRYEAKHEGFKRLASIIGNFVNIGWTLANRHQHRQCYELMAESSIDRDLVIGKGTLV